MNLRRKKEDVHLLIIDNLKSHLTYDILRTAKENNIELLAFPANCTHIMQPLDINIFKIFKSKLRDKIPERITNLSVSYLSNIKFVELISDVWLEVFDTEIIKRSFQLTGIHPLNDSLVYDRMDNKIKANSKENSKANINTDNKNEGLFHTNSPTTYTKSKNNTQELCEEFDAIKKTIVNLQIQILQLQNETLTKKRKEVNTKITPSRIMTSNEAIEEAKKAKDNKNKLKKSKKNVI